MARGGLGTVEAERGCKTQEGRGRKVHGGGTVARALLALCFRLGTQGHSELEDMYCLGRGLAGVDLPWAHCNFVPASLGPHDQGLQ